MTTSARVTLNSTIVDSNFRPVKAVERPKKHESNSRSKTANLIIKSISRSAIAMRSKSTFLLFLCVTITLTSNLSLCDNEATLKSPVKQTSQQLQQQSQRQRQKPEVSSHSKEQLASSLADQIERQHFKSKLRIPSINQLVHSQRPSKFDSGDNLSSDSTNFISSNISARPIDKSYLSNSETDASMRQILRMHENFHRPPTTTTKQSSSAEDSTQARNRWHLLPHRPVQIVSDLFKPRKMISQVLSYISPVVASKPASSHSDQGGGRASSTLESFAHLRANPLIPFLNKAKVGSLVRPFTSAPQESSYLAKPDFTGKSNSGAQFSTQPSNVLQSLFKSAPETEDLMESDSNLAPVQSSASSSTPKEANTDTEREESSRFPAVKSWIKSNANQLAQKYFQDSLRGLVALSQLPIISPVTPISTAPSVLEKVGNHNTTQSKRLRAIEELYRYAYLLSTGVNRKRDPLKALGLGSNGPKSSKLDPLSQRSIGQLMSSSSQNKNVRPFKSLLSNDLFQRAKPRGVLWDMSTDPSLAVTVFHLLERASVALPLGKFDERSDSPVKTNLLGCLSETN